VATDEAAGTAGPDAARGAGGADGWAVLADRSRRAIVMELADGERTVGELTAALPISQPAVSQHLKVLRDAGLVHDRPEGTRRRYRLNEHGVAALRDQLDTFWRRALENFESSINEPDPLTTDEDGNR
jgi:DNA-binding transcriptional ArsR family regulator